MNSLERKQNFATSRFHCHRSYHYTQVQGHPKSATPFRVDVDMRYHTNSVCFSHHNHTRENLHTRGPPHWRRGQDSPSSPFHIFVIFGVFQKSLKKENECGTWYERREKSVGLTPPTWITVFLYRHTGLLLEPRRTGASVLWIHFQLRCTIIITAVVPCSMSLFTKNKNMNGMNGTYLVFEMRRPTKSSHRLAIQLHNQPSP